MAEQEMGIRIHRDEKGEYGLAEEGESTVLITQNISLTSAT